MRVRIGSKIKSKQGEIWIVTHIDSIRKLIELENSQGTRFHLPLKAISSHGKKIGWFSRFSQKKGARK